MTIHYAESCNCDSRGDTTKSMMRYSDFKIEKNAIERYIEMLDYKYWSIHLNGKHILNITE